MFDNDISVAWRISSVANGAREQLHRGSALARRVNY
jgi:hypothetical protein